MLAQLSGQGRLAVGAILGAATAALFLVGITTGPEVTVGRAELPLAMTDVPSTSGAAAAPVGATDVLTATISATTTTSTTARTTTSVTGPTSLPTVTSTVTPSTSAPPQTTTSRPTRTRRPPTRPPCFLFC